MKKQTKNFKEAAQGSLDERWLPMSKAETTEEMREIEKSTECELCSLQIRRHGIRHGACGECPLQMREKQNIYPCCAEYYRWDDYVDEGDLKGARKEAKAIVKLLKTIVKG